MRAEHGADQNGLSEQFDLQNLAGQLRRAGLDVSANPYLISFCTDNFKMVLFRDGRALIHGTSDISRAKSFYHKWIG